MCVATTDIDAMIRRSEIELPRYELKQGLLKLDVDRCRDVGMPGKILKTICAIANIGPLGERDENGGICGRILLGVCDKEGDASRIKQLDGVDGLPVGARKVVGVDREAKALGISLEQYLTDVREMIRASGLSQTLKDAVLSNLDYNVYYGVGVLIINVPVQNELSYLDEQVYWREGDTTKLAESPKRIADLAMRFK